MHDLKADCLEEKLNLATPMPMKSEARPLRRVPVSFTVRWREFRIQLLPILAFGASLVLAGFLWQAAVLPVAVEPATVPAPHMAQALDPDPPLVPSPTLHQVTHAGTNGISKVPAARE